MANDYDVIVLGGGAAGLMCAITAGQRGKRVLLIENTNKFGKKILMSGGGRCNFTNLEIGADNFISSNPHFVKSALAQYTQWDFIALVAKHAIDYHEKKHGQLFCDHSSKDIMKMLLEECQQAAVTMQLNTEVSAVKQEQGAYIVESARASYAAQSLVVATGGLSIPTLGGATGLGYRLAEQFGLTVNPRLASLVPFTLSGAWQQLSAKISGVSVPVNVSVPAKNFTEDMLFTHRGISGPAILQLSNYWQAGEPITIDLLPDYSIDELSDLLKEIKQNKPNSLLRTALCGLLPNALAQVLLDQWWPQLVETPMQGISNEQIQQVCSNLKQWLLKPSGTEGYRTAEVTKGGVDSKHLSSKTMQVVDQPGLYFIGEVVDVVGHLGGFNFQWAWSSGYVAGMNA